MPRAAKAVRTQREYAGSGKPRATAKKIAGRGESEPPAKKPRQTAPGPRNPKPKTVKFRPAEVALWKPLSQSAADFIAVAIDNALLNALPRSGSEQEDCQRHLRQLKERLLDRSSALLVPPQKPRGLTNCRRLLALEESQLCEGNAALRALQEELDCTLDGLERGREEADTLQDQIRQLSDSLEQEDLPGPQDDASGCPDIPTLPPASFLQPTLQEQLMGIENRSAILSDLRTLQRSPQMANLLTFLERAHSEADHISQSGR